jgi:hypothetical protein
MQLTLDPFLFKIFTLMAVGDIGLKNFVLVQLELDMNARNS